MYPESTLLHTPISEKSFSAWCQLTKDEKKCSTYRTMTNSRIHSSVRNPEGVPFIVVASNRETNEQCDLVLYFDYRKSYCVLFASNNFHPPIPDLQL
ncbi:hypothetical protein TNCT_171181 [Trichonephila clavata]|uniref:Uncharacterized protein n=1 Tax=Trichonephila clavata TaxID=2740835 RepID=A0A8X6J1U9_TRICU|nr:hypothetical protein TNCT_171181 [Trichonephila clavata]